MNRLMQNAVIVLGIMVGSSMYGMFFELSPQFVAAKNLFYSTQGMLQNCLLLNQYVKKYQKNPSGEGLKKMNDQLALISEKIKTTSQLGVKGFERAYHDAQHGLISDVTLLSIAQLEYQVLKNLYLSSYVSALPSSAFDAWHSLEGTIKKLQKKIIG